MKVFSFFLAITFLEQMEAEETRLITVSVYMLNLQQLSI